MLVQLVLKNVLSFRDETVFTMAGEGGALETVAGVYGANAAGKSNLVKALGMLQRLLVHGTDQDDPLEQTPFALDQVAAAESSAFEAIVQIGAHRYEYALSYRTERIESERLFRDGSVVFNREFQNIRTGSVWPDDPQYIAFIAQGTRVTQPFLTEAAARNVDGANTVRSWFRNNLCIFGVSEPRIDIGRIEQDAALRAYLGSTLAAWGTGVREVRVDRHEASTDTFKTIWEAMNREVIGSVTADRNAVRALSLGHAGANGRTISIPLLKESDGTRRLLGLLPLLHDAVPRTYVVDELDRSLHAALTRRFVDEFRLVDSSAAQPSQLIFTSHDTTLLTGALQKPEELWFAEKDPTGASTLYSLAEFKPEQLEGLQADLARGYLSGRFGAVPFPIPTGAPTWLKGNGS